MPANWKLTTHSARPNSVFIHAGGGSALLPSPHPPITLEEEMTFTKLLASNGATIQELNTVRKNIEVLKGGGLAKAAKPAKVSLPTLNVTLSAGLIIGQSFFYLSVLWHKGGPNPMTT